MTRTKIHVTITKINVHRLTQSLKIKLWQHTCVYEINHLQVYFITPPQIIQQQKINTYIEIPEIFIIILQNTR